MIKFFLLFLVPFTLHAFEIPLVRVSLDKDAYNLKEKSLLVAEVNVSPENVEYDFILEALLNGAVTEMIPDSDFVWSAQEQLETPGTNLWEVKVYFIKKTFSKPIRDALKKKRATLKTENDPNLRSILEHDIANLEAEVVNLRHFVKTFPIEFTVINTAPTVSLVAPASVGVATDFTLDASNSLDPDGTIVRYDWDLGDGHVVQDGGPVLVHSYDTVGNYQVSVKATDNWGLESIHSVNIMVSSFLCESKDDYDSNSCLGTFVATSMEDLYRYSENFGLQNGSHKDLKIAFNLTAESSVRIHSPCRIFVEKNRTLKATNLCLDAKEGVIQTENFAIDVLENLLVLSGSRDVKLPANLSVKAQNASIKAQGKVQINTRSNFLIGQTLSADGAVCEIAADAQLQAHDYIGNCF